MEPSLTEERRHGDLLAHLVFQAVISVKMQLTVLLALVMHITLVEHVIYAGMSHQIAQIAFLITLA
jgi:hypothetical protein